MNINELTITIKKKLKKEIDIEHIEIEDKSYLHKNHKGHQEGKFHIKILLKSANLKTLSKLESTKKIYKVLSFEMKNFIHSIQISIK